MFTEFHSNGKKVYSSHRDAQENGFTLIELMIILGIISLLANMGFSSYQKYDIRTKVSTGLALASTAKVAVAGTYQSIQRFPITNDKAGLATAASITNNYVTSVSIGPDPTPGTITVTYKTFAQINAGDSIQLIPTTSSGSITWACSSATIKEILLPRICR